MQHALTLLMWPVILVMNQKHQIFLLFYLKNRLPVFDHNNPIEHHAIILGKSYIDTSCNDTVLVRRGLTLARMRVRKSAYTKVGLRCMALVYLVCGAVHARVATATWAVYVHV